MLNGQKLGDQYATYGTRSYLWYKILPMVHDPTYGTRSYLWYMILPMVQDPTNGTRSCLWYKILPMVQDPTYGTRSYQWYKILPMVQDPTYGTMKPKNCNLSWLTILEPTISFLPKTEVKNYPSHLGHWCWLFVNLFGLRFSLLATEPEKDFKTKNLPSLINLAVGQWLWLR